MVDVGGQDATEAFEDVGHSDEAREVLEGLLIGTLKRQVRDVHQFTFLCTCSRCLDYVQSPANERAAITSFCSLGGGRQRSLYR